VEEEEEEEVRRVEQEEEEVRRSTTARRAEQVRRWSRLGGAEEAVWRRLGVAEGAHARHIAKLELLDRPRHAALQRPRRPSRRPRDHGGCHGALAGVRDEPNHGGTRAP